MLLNNTTTFIHYNTEKTVFVFHSVFLQLVLSAILALGELSWQFPTHTFEAYATSPR